MAHGKGRDMQSNETLWRCNVCGYVHSGETAPELCPVCGADQGDFERFEETVDVPRPAVVAGRWQCDMCNAIHDGAAAPDVCPVCGAEAASFQPVVLPESTGSGIASIVVIGAGIAGVSAIEAARRVAPDADITLLSREDELPYYRLNLTRYLAGDIGLDELPIHPASWYEEQGIALHCNTDAIGIDPVAGVVSTREGRQFSFERLVLAMGSHPFVPPIDGVNMAGVFALRTAADIDGLLCAVRDGGRVVCIGGGVLGLEAAGALAQRGVDVTLLESHEWLMPRQLDRRASARLERHLAAMGIVLRKEARSAAIVGDGHAQGVRLVDGTTLPASTVVIATGVRPNTSLARKAGLAVNTGIVVDSHMLTSIPTILAAGDVAEHNGVLYGLWGASLAQGAIAGMNAGGGTVSFGGIPRTSTLKVLGVDLVSIGQFQPADGSWVVLADEDDARLRHFVFHDGVLAGAILMGDSALAPAVRRAVETRRSFVHLLHGSALAADVASALQE